VVTVLEQGYLILEYNGLGISLEVLVLVSANYCVMECISLRLYGEGISSKVGDIFQLNSCNRALLLGNLYALSSL